MIKRNDKRSPNGYFKYFCFVLFFFLSKKTSILSENFPFPNFYMKKITK